MEFLTVKQMALKYPFFTENALRWIIFNRHTNGADVCIRKVGRKVLFESTAFIQWLDGQKS